MLKLSLLLALFMAFMPGQSFAAKFTSQYCEFELPVGWACALEGTEWVCQSSNKDRQREAIIILAAKIRGDSDSLDYYQNHLTQSKTFMLPGGKTQVSEPKYARKWESTADKHPWIDALHMASEVPGFFTRYMATTKEDLGIAVTFSVAKDHYDSYQDVFQRIIDSMRVFRQGQATGDFKLATRDEGGIVGDIPAYGDGTKYDISNAQTSRGKTNNTSGSDYFIILLVLAGLGFAVYKLKNKKGSASAKKKKKK